jgi:hypothetical protein
VIKWRRMRWARHVARRGRREVYTGFWWGNLKERGVNGRMDLQELGCGGVNRIELTQDRDRWRALVTAVMNLLFP